MLNNGQTLRSVAWAPAPYRNAPPARRALQGANIGQSAGFMASPVVNVMADVATAATAGYFASLLGRAGNDWSTFWWVVSGLASFRALYDLSKLEKKA